MRIPVLTYHSNRILGNTYETNDLIALASDLCTIQTHRFHIVPLRWVVEWVLGLREESTLHKAVAISLDDGANFDYYDLDHLHWGPQRGVYTILRNFQARVGPSAQPDLHVSSFVIVSPEARREIGTYKGINWMTDEWWKAANESGMMGIYSHSWDHNHLEVSTVCEKSQQKGSFLTIDTYEECQAEVQRAAEYIHHKISPAWPELFAYPWGQSSEYLREVYFPQFQEEHRTLAAFSTDGDYVRKTSSRWNLPRLVCGAEWRSTVELIRILDGAQ